MSAMRTTSKQFVDIYHYIAKPIYPPDINCTKFFDICTDGTVDFILLFANAVRPTISLLLTDFETKYSKQEQITSNF